jgi:putative FmdB family regulatory protein
MPFYDYRCKSCENVQEEFHSVAECNEETLQALVCSKCGKKEMKRLIGTTNVDSFSIMTMDERRDSLKKRSRDHFKKELQDKFHQMNHPGYIP